MNDLRMEYNFDTGNGPELTSALKDSPITVLEYIEWLEEKLTEGLK